MKFSSVSPHIETNLPFLAEALGSPAAENLAYRGFFGSLVRRAELGVSHADPQVIFDVARIVRAVIDEKDRKNGARIGYNQVLHVTEFAEHCISQTDVEDSFNQLALSGLLRSIPSYRIVRQKHDTKTALALNLDSINSVVDKMVKKIDGDCLFICLCHGGFIPGLATYIAWKKSRSNDNSMFYPARLSMSKHYDKSIRLDQNEVDHLKALSADKQIVIFDEDIHSGATLDLAEKQISEKIHPDIVVLSCLGQRPKTKK